MNHHIDQLLAELTLAEKAALTAGEDFWSTVAVGRLGIPKVRVTDGPSGARGATFPGATGSASTCVPCGSAMGATWDPALAEEIGALVGREALDRGCRVLLAPTVNLHRSPLAGRNFECYSEDPLLSGLLAAGFVRGVQGAGVIATVKHLVANDAEFERGTISSVVDERSLRELYLLPFELAVRQGGALGIMTSYNRLNGKWLNERPEILLDILRGEWGFDGLVMTDWFAIADTASSTAAGVDLEMPGPGRALGASLIEAVNAGDLEEAAVDGAVRRLLGAFARIGALQDPTPPEAPRPPETSDINLVRRAAAAGSVLLRNDGILPLEPAGLRGVAVIGPNADAPRIMGGGSSEVTPHRLQTPLEALREVLPAEVQLRHERGCGIDRTPRPIGGPGLRSLNGFTVELFVGTELSGEPIGRKQLETLRLLAIEAPHPELTGSAWSARLQGTLLPGESGDFTLSLAQNGRARVLVGGELVLDGFTAPPPPGGTELFGFASQEAEAVVTLEAGEATEIVVEYATIEATLPGFRIGFRAPEPEDLLDRAVAAARGADVAVVVVGTTAEWESETRDRPSFSLPGDQDELVRRVAAANPRTIVIVNAGTPVDLPWADDVAAVLQCWFGGQELAGALADMLLGHAEPGGRLPTTIPQRLEHNPSHDNFPGENGELRYGEGLFMGYRGYDHRCLPTRFPFGHGLGYTTFEFAQPTPSRCQVRAGDAVTINVVVTNTGHRRGSSVVQCYVSPRDARLARPPKELKAAAKVLLKPGESTTVELVLEGRAFAYWDPGQADWPELEARAASMMGVTPDPPHDRRSPGWQIDPGIYDVLIGRSSADITGVSEITLVAP